MDYVITSTAINMYISRMAATSFMETQVVLSPKLKLATSVK